MAISRKPKEKTDQPLEQMFDVPTAQIFEDVDNEDSSDKHAEEDRVEQMAKQLADMQKSLSDMHAVNMQLMAGGGVGVRQQEQQSFQPQDPLKVELPDPALDPEGYDRALAERNRIRAENARGADEVRNRNKKSVEDKANALKAAFEEKYPEMAEDEERMSFVTAQVAREAGAKGLDIERYMFVNQNKFIDDVAAKYKKVFGDPNADEGEDDRDYQEDRRPAARTRTQRRTSTRDRQEDDEGRSAGIFGGSESGGRPGKGKERDEVGGDLISDMQAMQRKTGFF